MKFRGTIFLMPHRHGALIEILESVPAHDRTAFICDLANQMIQTSSTIKSMNASLAPVVRNDVSIGSRAAHVPAVVDSPVETPKMSNAELAAAFVWSDSRKKP